METAKIFKNSNSQAVRLPKAYQFDVSEVQIFRRGDEIVLKHLQSLQAGMVLMSSITFAELMTGAKKAIMWKIIYDVWKR